MSRKEKVRFEEAFSRLEIILEKLNSGAVSLDESVTLYEEADGLIVSCQKQLSEAEKKIERLVKEREGTIQLDSEGNPKTEPYPSETERGL